jgi:ECF transporter S component (folate family)
LPLIKKRRVYMRNTRIFVFMGLLIALEIILTRFLSIQLPIVRIGFGFIAVSMAGMMLGPVAGGVTAALADVIRMMLFPMGTYFPGFTLSAFLSGAIYGLFLHRKQKSILRIAVPVVLIRLFVDICLNSIWLYILTKKAVIPMMIARVTTSAVMIPVQIITIYVVWKLAGKYIENMYSKELKYN